MKTILYYLVLASSSLAPKASECDIKQIYNAITPQTYNTMVLTTSGELEEIDVILVPSKLDEGNYEGYANKKASNLYRIDNTNVYLETRYCYEYSDDVIIKIESNYGYNKGKIIFD